MTLPWSKKDTISATSASKASLITLGQPGLESNISTNGLECRQRFDDYMEEGYAGRELWEDEDYYRAGAPPLGKEWVWVDPHLLATPSIADIDGDGNDEMVMAVSYFFDKDHYADPVSL